MEFFSLFVVALMPVLKTLLVTAVGLFLALDRVNILGPVARHHLNNLVFFVLTPSLVASNLADTITASNIVSLWFMPINILLTFIIGSALGWILIKVTRTPQHLHGLVISCCSAGNLGNLPLVIIPALCDEANSPFGDSSTCSTNGVAYASLSMAIGAVYIWSYIYNIIRAYASKSVRDIDIIESSNIIKSSNGTSEFSESYTEALLLKNSEFSESNTEALLLKDSPRSKDYEAQAEIIRTGSEDKIMISNNVLSEDYEAQAEIIRTGSEDKVSIFKKIKEDIKNFAEKINLKMVFAPATIATIVGLLIGVVSPIRKIMIGDSAPLRVIESSASLLGKATIPSMTLIMGANLLKGLKKSTVSIWVVIGIQVVRYIILPLLGIVVVKAAHHFGLVGSDSLYQFVLLLQYAVPSAMTIGTITQLFEIGQKECSVIMLWNYAVASLFLTLWSTCFMWIVS